MATPTMRQQWNAKNICKTRAICVRMCKPDSGAAELVGGRPRWGFASCVNINTTKPKSSFAS